MGEALQQQRVMHCSDNNKTTGAAGRSMLASIQLPSTLYYQLLMLDRDVNTAKNIAFTAFENSTLFPQVNTGKVGSGPKLDVVSTVVLGSTIAALEPFNLSEPVYLILGRREGGPAGQPAWWDPRANNGLGSWQPEYCRLLRARRQSAVFSCQRLGHYALVTPASLLPSNHQNDLTGGQRMHPAIFAGTAVALVALASTLLVYSLGYPRIGMSRKLKHALPNCWISFVFLLVLHLLLGDIDNENLGLCRSLSLLLQYFVLTSALWITVCTSIVHSKLVNPMEQGMRHSNPYVVNPEQEVYMAGDSGKRMKKPVARFYLAGWGVPLIICGISGGAGLPLYSPTICFLASAPAAGAVLVPVLLTSTVTIYFVIAILTISPERRPYSHSLLKGNREESQASLCTQSTLLVPDTEHSPRSQALALLTTCVLYLLLLVLACLAATAPLADVAVGTQVKLFSAFFAIASSCLGITILTFYCFLRGDLLSQFPKPCASPEETSNLVNLTELSGHRKEQKVPMVEKNLAAFSSLPSLDKPEPQAWLGGSVLGPSSARVKQCNVERGDSEVSSDYHSINNAAHLRRPRHLHYPAAVGLSEGEAQRSVTDLLGQYQMSKMKISNVNIHTNEGMSKVAWGSTGWDAGSQFTSSPMELPCPDSQMLEQPPLLQRPPPLGDSAPYFPPPRDPLPSFSSLPRKGRSSKSRERWRGSRATANSDWERLEVSSRYSELSSSTAHSSHSRPSQGRRQRSRPRRKPRKRSEVLLSGASTPRHRHEPIMEVSSSRVEEEEDDGPQPAPLPRLSSTSSSSEGEAPPPLPLASPLLPPSPAPSSPSPAPSSINIFPPTSRDLDLANKETCV